MEPGPGGDPIRNPMVLPTGKNIHALDPQSIPTQAALKSARVVVERCALHPSQGLNQGWHPSTSEHPGLKVHGAAHVQALLWSKQPGRRVPYPS